MKSFLKISFLLLCVTFLSNNSIIAQKFGYVNSKELILLLPEAKAADSELEALQKKLGESLEAKINTFRTDVAKFEKAAYLDKTLSPVQIEEQGGALAQREKKLADEEREMTQKIVDKRTELLSPILEKIDKAIKAVGKEGNYTMIFDSSGLNVLLYAEDSVDVMPQVKAKLGI